MNSPHALTWGVEKDKYNGYSVPIASDGETAKKIGELVEYHKTKSPLYGASNTIYLRSANLTPKQMDELYEKGRLYVEIGFELVGISTKNGVSYLSFRVTKLRRTERPSGSEPGSLCPED